MVLDWSNDSEIKGAYCMVISMEVHISALCTQKQAGYPENACSSNST